MRVRTLGGLELEGARLTRPKPLLLLAYLALEGPRDKRHLADLFWPRAKSPRRSLHVALSQLRQGAPGSVDSGDRRVGTPVTTDADAFLEHVEARAVDEAEAAYRGAFLAGLDLPLGLELEEWVFRTREFLAGRARTALLERAEADAAEGRWIEAGARAERAAALEGAGFPEANDLARLHALLLAADRPRAATLRRDADGFGLELPDSVADARAWLRHRLGDGPLPTPPPVPAGTGPLVGRREEANAIVAQLRGGDRLVSLLGPPGVGKTRLAVHVAGRLARSGEFEEVRFVPLESAWTAQRMLRAVAETLRPDEALLDGGLDQLARLVGGRRVLLVLDNLEQLAGDVATLGRLSERCPGLTIVATSRERLNLREERAVVLRGLPVPPDGASPRDASAYPALELFVQGARRASPTFALDAATTPAAAEICRRVDGLPLGIELAAAWLRLLPVEEVARELASSVDLLETHLRDVPERHRSLRAAFAWSWTLLGSRERDAFARLSVFRGGFRRDAAQRVAGATLSVLASLADKSLVRVEPTGRYAVHPLLVRLGREQLVARRGLAESERRHAEYFLALAETAEPHLTGPDPEPWLGRLDAEHDNLRAALAHLEREDVDLAMRLASALWRFWVVRGHNREGRERLEALLDLPGARRASALRARLLQALGTMTFQAGDFARAEPLLRDALHQARAHGATTQVASILASLAWTSVHLGDVVPGAEYGQEALRRNLDLGHVRGVALAHNALAYHAVFRGAFRDAERELAESLRRFEQLGDERGIAHLRTNTASVKATLGAYGEADALLDDALNILSRIGDRQLLAWALLQRTMSRSDQARTDEARRDAERALATAEEVGNRELSGIALTASADVLTTQRRFDEAARRLARAQATWRTAGYPWVRSATHRVATRLARARGDVDAADRELRAAATLAVRIGDRHGMAQCAEEGAFLTAERRPERAARLLGVAEALRESCSAPVPPRVAPDRDRTASGLRRTLGRVTLDRLLDEARAAEAGLLLRTELGLEGPGA